MGASNGTAYTLIKNIYQSKILLVEDKDFYAGAASELE
jgi:hypothetical protein